MDRKGGTPWVSPPFAVYIGMIDEFGSPQA